MRSTSANVTVDKWMRFGVVRGQPERESCHRGGRARYSHKRPGGLEVDARRAASAIASSASCSAAASCSGVAGSPREVALGKAHAADVDRAAGGRAVRPAEDEFGGAAADVNDEVWRREIIDGHQIAGGAGERQRRLLRRR